jgi:hypothetical protein
MPISGILATYVRDLDVMDEDRHTLARRADAGTAIRLARGAYVDTEQWQSQDERSQYLTRIRAVWETRRHEMVLSHWSAAAIHNLPILDAWPTKTHVTVGKVSGGRSRNDVVKHALRIPDADVVEVDGLLVTSVARTVIDMAVSAGYLTAVMVADRALLVDRFARVPPMAQRDELWTTFGRRGNFQGRQRAKFVVQFAATRSESPLESVSRANMHLVRCPPPELQISFRDAHGYIGDTDFRWEQFRVAGEADGRAKYLEEPLRGGRTTAEVLVDEKLREDRIRATGESVTRWPWEVGVNPTRLRAHLMAAGIPIP